MSDVTETRMDAEAHGASVERMMERPHPLTPLVEGWVFLASLVPLVAEESAHDKTLRHHMFIVSLVVAGIVLLFLLHGFVVWRGTRFRVNEQEVVIEHHVIAHRNERIPVSRIQAVEVQQPLAARLLGMAAVKINVGSGRPQRLSYLPRARAYVLRDFLLAHAGRVNHGDTPSAAPAGMPLPTGSASSAWTDEDPNHRVVAKADPVKLLLAVLTSHQFVTQVAMPVLVFAVLAVLVPWKYLVVLVPVATMVASSAQTILSHHLLKQWHYTLTDSHDGLRVSRGLTELVSESIPRNRVQSLVIKQSLLWRPLGLYRVHVDVLGGTFSRSRGVVSGNMLLPAGTWQDVTAVVAAIWPEVDADALLWHRVGRRGAWLRPCSWWTHAWALNADIAGTRHGLIDHTITLAPHARVQSVSLNQKWRARWLHLATVGMHTAHGMGTWQCALLDEATASWLFRGELARAREARRHGRVGSELAVASIADEELPNL